MDPTELWTELHVRALTFEASEETPNDKIFLWHFANKIPRYTPGCACHEFFQSWREKSPPDYSSKDSYFKWTYDLHSQVNAKLGKPNLSLEEARKKYESLAEQKMNN